MTNCEIYLRIPETFFFAKVFCLTKYYTKELKGKGVSVGNFFLWEGFPKKWFQNYLILLWKRNFGCFLFSIVVGCSQSLETLDKSSYLEASPHSPEKVIIFHEKLSNSPDIWQRWRLSFNSKYTSILTKQKITKIKQVFPSENLLKIIIKRRICFQRREINNLFSLI